jgi:peptidyl-prolyl cis-trans isomerase C
MTISVNGVAISDAAIHAEMQYHPARSVAAAQREAAQALVVKELLALEASSRGFGEGPDGIAALLEEAISVPDADEETCRRYYAQNRKRFRSPDLFEAQHILIAAAPDDGPARETARLKAETLLAEIERDPARFEALAREHSECPSRDQGGHLGQITRGSTVPEFETFLFSLDPGETCAKPVPSRYGFHIVRLLHREAGRELPFDHVKQKVADYLQESAWRRAVHQYIQLLVGRARIEGIDLGGATSMLVQ